MRWDADAVRDDLRAYVVEHLGDPGGVLVLDETGFLKKGAKSAGVQRQYSGTAGRIENCQIGVFLAYASRHGRALIDRALYLPEVWTEDRDAAPRPAFPQEVAFATKPQARPGRCWSGPMPPACRRLGDGRQRLRRRHALRRWMEEPGLGYVLAVTKRSGWASAGSRTRVEEVPADAWHRLSAGDGAKGPRLYDWAYLPYGGDAAPAGRRAC